MQNLSYENEFCLQFHFHANQSHFHKNGFALRLALQQRYKRTRKCPIILLRHFNRNSIYPLPPRRDEHLAFPRIIIYIVKQICEKKGNNRLGEIVWM